MVRALLVKLKNIGRAGDGSDRVSILLPFVIISIGLGVLAWRSYQLSAQTERGVETLGMQYAGYAADITARRLDAAARAEIFRASEDWQQVERRASFPTSAALQEWVTSNGWIVSAIYIPDADPGSSIFVSEPAPALPPDQSLEREFYTSSGLVRYSYDPTRLLERVRDAARQQPLIQSQEQQPQARISVVRTPKRPGPIRTGEGFTFISPLGPPLSQFAVRALVPATYGTSGWENARFISLWVSLVALALTTLGAYLALRGLRREAETMKLRGALVANVSHELRTPLSMIRLGAETLKRSTKLTDRQRHDIEDSILREVVHLSHLVENVLDIGRMQSGGKILAFTPVCPRDPITTVISTYESWIRSKGFEVSLHIEETVDEQMWDRDAVSRALLNLIDNAVKYSGDEKLLTIALRQTTEHVILEVQDRGIGIASNDLLHIFEPYYRAQFSDTQTRRGAGLGLTLVHQIVASHGGRIEVDSTPGSGSTFRLLFPRPASPKPTPAPALAEARQAS
jgi:signal transduction histidine kinase